MTEPSPAIAIGALASDIPVAVIAAVVSLLLVATLAALITRRLGFPYTIGLVLVGLVLGWLAERTDNAWLRSLQTMRLTPNIIMYVLLPTLVFDAALNMDLHLLLRNLRPVLGLAGPGLVVAMLITGAITAWTTPLTLGAAMLFGALISATDPVAVIALFKELGAPRRLTMLVDGESLFNDATAIVAFQIVSGLLAGGALTLLTAGQAGLSFLAVFVGGALAGAVIGWLMIAILNLTRNDPVLQILLSVVVAYSAFIIAQYCLKLSGVMAAVGAGLVVNFMGRKAYTETANSWLRGFWSLASFVANSFVFLLVGLTQAFLFHPATYSQSKLLYIVAAIMAVQAGRFVIVFGGVPLLNRICRQPVSSAYSKVIFWGGLRGALPIALAISISPTQLGPDGEDLRSLIIVLTLGVVLFTLLVQGASIRRLMHRLKLDQLSLSEQLAQGYGQRVCYQTGLEAIDRIASRWELSPQRQFITDTRQRLQARSAVAEQAMHDLHQDARLQEQAARVMLWTQTVSLCEHTYHQLLDNGLLSPAGLRRCLHFCDWLREHISLGQLPTDAAIVPALEAGSSFWRLLSVLHHWRSRFPTTLGNLSIRLKFETTLAQMVTLGQIEAEISQLQMLSRPTPEDLEYLRQWCQQGRLQMRAHLAELECQQPQLIARLESHAFQRAILHVETRTLDDLHRSGALPENVFQHLLEEVTHLAENEQPPGAAG